MKTIYRLIYDDGCGSITIKGYFETRALTLKNVPANNTALYSIEEIKVYTEEDETQAAKDARVIAQLTNEQIEALRRCPQLINLRADNK